MDNRKKTDEEIYRLFDFVVQRDNIGMPRSNIAADLNLSVSTVNKVLRAKEYARNQNKTYLDANRKSLGRAAAWAWDRYGALILTAADLEDPETPEPDVDPASHIDFGEGPDLTVVACRIDCPVCGFLYEPTAARHYIAEAPPSGGLSVALGGAPLPLFDAYDCPRCGAQYRAQPRAREAKP